MPAVNPTILQWARETASMTLEEAARAIQLKDGYGRSGAERLAALEAGKEIPSAQMLSKMAKAYRRPLLVFYLEQPPRATSRGQDFRNLPGASSLPYDANLDALIRDMTSRQMILRSILEEEDDPIRRFVGSTTIDVGFDTVAASVTATLNFELAVYRSRRGPDAAFNYLRRQMAQAGIFVLLASNLGSHHSTIPVETFRGFAIADPVAPLIVINDQDARAAWPFTALHEVTHLWLGTTGVSGGYVGSDIEQFCNNVAGEILVPTGELGAIANVGSLTIDEIADEIADFAQARNVSHSMVAYRLYRAKAINEAVWHELNSRYRSEWKAIQLLEYRGEEGGLGGPNYYTVRRHRLGRAVLDTVGRSLAEGSITVTTAAQVLGVAPRGVSKLLGAPL